MAGNLDAFEEAKLASGGAKALGEKQVEYDPVKENFQAISGRAFWQTEETA
jgi:hypothetical protein